MPFERRVLVEACVSSIPEALEAEAAGADRLELCGPGTGGTTPSIGLVSACLAQVRIPVHVMIRPHSGHFILSAAWRAVMCQDIQAVLEAGAQGVVCGSLTPAGEVDEVALQDWLAAADGAPLVFHRAFDRIADPERALDVLCNLGVAAVLTSGGASSAREGEARLSELRDRAGDRLTVIAGGGVRAHNVRSLLDDVGVRAVHARATVAAPFEALVRSVRAWEQL